MKSSAGANKHQNRNCNYDGLAQTQADDQPKDLEQELLEPVELDTLARLYGLDLAKLIPLTKQPEESSEKREATGRCLC